MPGLWVLIAVLVVGVVLALLAPLWRRGAPPARRDEYDIAVYKDQLEEVERDLERATLTDEQADGVRTEIKRRMIAAAPGDEAPGDDASQATPDRPATRRSLAITLGLGLPLGALAFYLFLGTPDYPGRPFAERQPTHDTAGLEQPPDVDAMVRQLEQRLEKDPDNMKGWHLLARSLRSMERFADSAAAFRRLVTLSKRRPDVLLDYGEVLVMARDGVVPPAARALFEEVVAAGHDDPRGRFFLGIAKAQAGDLQGALDDWVALAVASPPDAPWLPVVQERIRKIAADMGIAPPEIARALPGPSRADVEAAKEMTPEERDLMIRSMVQRLADRLKDNPDDGEGWARLARAYQVLGETEKAAEAEKRAQALAGGGK